MDKNGVWQWPGDVVEDKQLPIKAAVALAVIKNAEKQRNALMFWHQGDVCGFFDMLCGRCNFDLLDDVQFAVRGSTTTSSTETCGVWRRLGNISSSRSSTGTQTHRSMAPSKPTKNGYKA